MKKALSFYRFEERKKDKTLPLQRREKVPILENKFKRKHILKFRVDDDEKAFIEAKAKIANCRHLSDYLRTTCIDGRIVQFDMHNIDFLKRQVAGACNNINQIAHVANATGHINSGDIAHMKDQVEDMFQKLCQVQEVIEGGLNGSNEY